MTMNPTLQKRLDVLHAEASRDKERWEARVRDEDGLVRLGEFFLAMTPDEGRMLYILALARNAQRVVEFGASFGISSLYLAAALGETNGHLITTEVHPDKCVALRKSFDEAGVSDQVTLLEGDARETLRDVEGPIDMLVLDGWKSMYLPVFELLRARLAPGALIVADNIFHDGSAAYLEMIRSSESGLVSSISGDMGLSYLPS
ncbi:MAG: class I SAM-dependent methyltransferase [Myxococcales bacterium]|nr:class I SAM-dependent methyltransferase [Myxococcales bacterium]